MAPAARWSGTMERVALPELSRSLPPTCPARPGPVALVDGQGLPAILPVNDRLSGGDQVLAPGSGETSGLRGT